MSKEKGGAFVATDRLRMLIFDVHRLSVIKFAEIFNIDEPRASRIINGLEEPSKVLLRRIYSYFHIDGVNEPLFAFNPNVVLGANNIIKEHDVKK